jgi:hypothetical protein
MTLNRSAILTTPHAPMRESPEQTEITVKLRPMQCELILTETQIIMAREIQGCVEDALALQRHGWCSLSLTPDQIEELQGFIAHDANDTKRKRLQQALDEIFDRLDDLLKERAGRTKRVTAGS